MTPAARAVARSDPSASRIYGSSLFRSSSARTPSHQGNLGRLGCRRCRIWLAPLSDGRRRFFPYSANCRQWRRLGPSSWMKLSRCSLVAVALPSPGTGPAPLRFLLHVASIEARSRSFDVVFPARLAEGLFPWKIDGSTLPLDTHRQRLSLPAMGAIGSGRSASSRALATASRRFIFSYPRVDVTQVRSRVPSLYALEILRSRSGTPSRTAGL